MTYERPRRNLSIRLSDEELALLQRAAKLTGCDGWSAYLRRLGVTEARELCAAYGGPLKDNDGPTLWEARERARSTQT